MKVPGSYKKADSGIKKRQRNRNKRTKLRKINPVPKNK